VADIIPIDEERQRKLKAAADDLQQYMIHWQAELRAAVEITISEMPTGDIQAIVNILSLSIANLNALRREYIDALEAAEKMNPNE
jgi:hypothetical protein